MSNNKATAITGASLSAAFGMAAVWFGTHCGGGFATGNQEVNFYVKYGWYAVFLPIIAMILLGWAHRNALVLAKDYKRMTTKAMPMHYIIHMKRFFQLSLKSVTLS